MSTLSLRLPDSIHNMVRETAKEDSVSTNQFIATAIAEKLSALSTVDYLEKRASKGNKQDFEKIMSRIPDVEPDEQGRI